MADEGKRDDERAGGPPPPPPSGARPAWGTPPGQSGDPSGGRGGWSPPPGPQGGHQGWAPPPGSPGDPQGRRVGGGPAGRGRLLPVRPLTVGDILDTAFRSLRATFATAALLVLIVQGPYQLISSFAYERLLPELVDPFALDIAPDDPAAALDLLARLAGIGAVIGLVGLVVNVLLGLAVVWVVLRTDRGEPVAVGAALTAGLRRAGATLGALLLLLLSGALVAAVVAIVLVVAVTIVPLLGALLALTLVPVLGLVWLASTYLIVPVAMVEGRGPWATLMRAWWVLGRRFWRTIGVTTLMLLLVMLLTGSLSLLFGFVAIVAGPFGWVVEAVGGTGVSLVSVPLTAFAALLVYLDARVRLEGYDLELRARDLGHG